LEFIEPERWPHAVDGAALLVDLANIIRKFVVLSAADAQTVALWCLHTYAFEIFYCTPRLAATSPEKRCGKTTLLDVIKELVARAMPTSSITAAALFRTVEIAKPTLLIDEADTFLRDNDELRGVLNSGHRRGGQVTRTIGDNHEPRVFSTHCPVVIAMIGKLPDTLDDRSIKIELKRRLPTEFVSCFRGDRVDALKDLARKEARWAADNASRLAHADPELPPGIFNREADNWRPPFCIAAIAGGEWPELVRRAAVASTGAPDDSLKVLLLSDIRDAFGHHDRISSDELVTALNEMKDRPWCEINHGRPLTQNQLAPRLKPFKLTPKKIRILDQTLNGYAPADFTEKCARYLPEIL
jgi:hypothetical protein